MISDDDMEMAIRQIVEYCRRYEGANRYEIVRLLEDLNEHISLSALDQTGRSARDAFFNAVATLLLIADPPGTNQLEATTSSLSELTNSTIRTITFDSEPLAGNANPMNWQSIDAELPPRRQLKDTEMATIEYFRGLLSDKSDHRRDQGEPT